MNEKHTRSLPTEVAWLGYGGLLPFVGLLAAIFLDPPQALRWTDALIGYGAVILAFVGALHWGFAISLPDLSPAQRRGCYIWSTLPALIAWPATVIAVLPAVLLLVAGFILHYIQDRRLQVVASLPAWYLPLRLRLTSVACLCLSIAAITSFS